MNQGLTRTVSTGLACDVCGRLPRPRRLRLTLAKLAAVFPVELLLHAVVLRLHPPYLVAVSALTLSTTALVIWVVEPSAMRLLRRWLHAPGHRVSDDIVSAPALWRIRTTVGEEAGALERLTRGLATLDANILGLHVHPLEHGAMDELVVAAPDDVHPDDLLVAVGAGGGRDPRIWPTTALALVDGQTSALSLAAGVVADPAELPHAVAGLLGARVVTDRDPVAPGSHLLKIPSPWSGLFVFTRPDEPFTPAESARAQRLAQVAEAAVSARLGHRSAED